MIEKDETQDNDLSSLTASELSHKVTENLDAFATIREKMATIKIEYEKRMKQLLEASGLEGVEALISLNYDEVGDPFKVGLVLSVPSIPYGKRHLGHHKELEKKVIAVLTELFPEWRGQLYPKNLSIGYVLGTEDEMLKGATRRRKTIERTLK